jgi:Domain of unknown function (DUF397)
MVLWRKSSYSYANMNCVEVAELPGGGVAIRDSKHPEAPPIVLTDDEWAEFVAGARRGEFDLPRLSPAS